MIGCSNRRRRGRAVRLLQVGGLSSYTYAMKSLVSLSRRRLLVLTSLIGFVLWSAPHVTASGEADGPIEPSTLRLRLEVPMAAFRPLLERTYDGQDTNRLGPQEWIPLGGGTGFMKYHARRAGSELALNGNHMVSRARIQFSMEYAKQSHGSLTKIADCGGKSTGGRAGLLGVQISSLFSYQRDYSFIPSSRITAVEALEACPLGPDRINGAPLMAQVYRSRLESALPLLDRAIRDAVPFKAKVSEAWARLQAPIQLDDHGTMWLVVAPIQTQSIEPAGTDGTLSAEIGIIAAPRVVMGKKPAAPFRPLPRMEGRYREQGFHVPFDLDVPYELANEELRKAVVGQEFGIGPGRLAIRRVHLYPVGKQAGVDLDVEGVISLRVKLRGTPVYDETTETIVFDHVEYDVAEQNVWTDLADQLLHESIRAQLSRRLKIPIRDNLEEMRRELEAALNRNIEGGTLRGKVNRIRLLDLAAGPHALSARFRTDGELRYDLH